MSRSAVAALLWTSLVTACGARTGLAVPDGGIDAAIDAPPDAPPDAMDAAVPPVCIEVPPDAGPVRASLTVPVSLAVVDVLFLLDATGSMVDEIDNVRRGLRNRVVPGVRAAIPDAAFGVAFAGEFPEPRYGPADVRPYELRAPITVDVVRVEGALEESPRWGNFDEPEAQVEALYQVATGEGLDPWIAPASGCPRGGSGAVCFRSDSLPVVLLATDAPFHNGPRDVRPYDPYDLVPAPHRYEDAVRALGEIGALVIGLGATDFGSASPMRHLRRIARDTGAVDDEGEPLVFDIGSSGNRVDDNVVLAVQRLASDVPLDVDALVRDAPGDEVDARTLVVAVRPLSADPPDAIDGIEGDQFLGVVPGTRVVFELEVDASGLEPTAATRRVPATVVFRAFRRSRVGSESVLIVIPGRDGGGCETP